MDFVSQFVSRVNNYNDDDDDDEYKDCVLLDSMPSIDCR